MPGYLIIRSELRSIKSPFGEGRLRVVEDLIPSLEPGDILSSFAPELLRLVDAASVDGVVQTTIGSWTYQIVFSKPPLHEATTMCVCSSVCLSVRLLAASAILSQHIGCARSGLSICGRWFSGIFHPPTYTPYGFALKCYGRRSNSLLPGTGADRLEPSGLSFVLIHVRHALRSRWQTDL